MSKQEPDSGSNELLAENIKLKVEVENLTENSNDLKYENEYLSRTKDEYEDNNEKLETKVEKLKTKMEELESITTEEIAYLEDQIETMQEEIYCEEKYTKMKNKHKTFKANIKKLAPEIFSELKKRKMSQESQQEVKRIRLDTNL